jgi:hypothetical protein
MIRFALFLGLLVHVVIAVWNGFFGPSLGAEGDALAFHQEAVFYANNLGRFEFVTGWIYAYFLGFLYRLFSDHLFFGSMVSVVAWFGSALLFVRIMRLLDQASPRIALALLLFSFWPSVALNTSVTLRESFQVLAVNLIAFGAVGSFSKDKGHWFSLFLGMALGSVLHGTLLVFSGLVFFYMMYYIAKVRLGLSKSTSILFVLFVGGTGLVLALTLFGSISYSINDGLVASIQTYNENASSANARADYRDQLDLSGSFAFVTFLPIAFFQYMLEPLPNHIGSVADAALFLENTLRAFLLASAVAVNFRLNRRSRTKHSFFLLSYLAISLIWAVGSVNWGTASRHHVPGLCLLLIAAFFAKPKGKAPIHMAARENVDQKDVSPQSRSMSQSPKVKNHFESEGLSSPTSVKYVKPIFIAESFRPKKGDFACR